MFTHENFEASQFAIEFTQIALQLMDEIPGRNSSLRDQLRRAALSIPLNIAEETAKTGRADRARFYAIARGSAMECAAICDIIALIDEHLSPKTELAKRKLRSVVSILSTVCSGR